MPKTDKSRSKNRKSSSKSSKNWLREHFDDAYVRQSRNDGYRSRASYKLLEINSKDHLLRPGMTLVDLGAAPGGWSQVAVSLVQPGGKVIASDILPMDPIPGVDFILGDFTEGSCLQALQDALQGRQIELVISDMAPNISGMAEIDQPRAMHLVDLAVDFARNNLKPGGNLLMKVFQGQGFTELLQELRASYETVLSRKPEASRARSKEVYILAKGLRRQA